MNIVKLQFLSLLTIRYCILINYYAYIKTTILLLLYYTFLN